MIRFKRTYTAQELQEISGATSLQGSPSLVLAGINTIEDANEEHLSFIAEDAYMHNLRSARAGLIIISDSVGDIESDCALLKHPNPRSALAKIFALALEKDGANEFFTSQQTKSKISDSAVIGSDCKIASTAIIGANVTIGDRVIIGDDVNIMPNAVIGNDVTIGARSKIFPSVVIYQDSVIGMDCCIQACTTIGSNGFGFGREDDKSWTYLGHLAKVVIGNRVNIGANTSIDRGFLSDTIIGDGCIIDNQVQIAHNVVIGDNSAIAGCSGIAGSAKIGSRCMFGGGVGISGHLSICDDVMLTASTSVNRSITEAGVYSSGMYAKPRQVWQKNIARFYKLDGMAKKLNSLNKDVEKIKTTCSNKEVESDE